MLKDVVVKLSGRAPLDFAADYATSIAATFGAHVTGIAFLYEPVIPDGTLGGVPVDLIELQREENSKIARDAISRFEAGVKKAGQLMCARPQSPISTLLARSSTAQKPQPCWAKCASIRIFAERQK